MRLRLATTSDILPGQWYKDSTSGENLLVKIVRQDPDQIVVLVQLQNQAQETRVVDNKNEWNDRYIKIDAQPFTVNQVQVNEPHDVEPDKVPAKRPTRVWTKRREKKEREWELR